MDPLTSSPIPLNHLQQVLACQNTILTPTGGDILFIRSGFTATFNALSVSSQQALAQRSTHDFAGLEATPAVLEWLWDGKFAAVAGDMPGFERSPPGGGKSETYKVDEVQLEGVGSLHEVVLGGWGCPIGEMFDLEGLAEHCRTEGRWSFFVCSVPLKVGYCGIARDVGLWTAFSRDR